MCMCTYIDRYGQHENDKAKHERDKAKSNCPTTARRYIGFPPSRIANANSIRVFNDAPAATSPSLHSFSFFTLTQHLIFWVSTTTTTTTNTSVRIPFTKKDAENDPLRTRTQATHKTARGQMPVPSPVSSPFNPRDRRKRCLLLLLQTLCHHPKRLCTDKRTTPQYPTMFV